MTVNRCNGDPNAYPPRRSRSSDPVRQLGAPVIAPDLTRPIMGRLGYMRCAAAVSRRRAIRQWLSRGSLVLSAGILIAFGAYVHSQSESARRPQGPTVPAALGNDLSRHQNRITNMIHRVREWAPSATVLPHVNDHSPAPAPEPSEDVHPQTEDNAVPRDAEHPNLAHSRWV